MAYGVRIGIRTNDPGILPRLDAHLPPGWSPAADLNVDCLLSLVVGVGRTEPGIRRYHLLYSAARRVSRTLDLGGLLRDLENHLDLYVAEAAGRRVFVHSGVVNWGGRAILIPGRSHSGKSTLVAALVRAGAAYLSDEYAVLDARGRVHPYSRPLQLRRRDGGSHSLSAEELGGRTQKKSLPVGLVVVVRYQKGGRGRLQPLSRGRAVLELLANAVPARARPSSTLATLRAAVSTSRAVKGVRGQATRVVPQILGLCEEAKAAERQRR